MMKRRNWGDGIEWRGVGSVDVPCFGDRGEESFGKIMEVHFG